MVPYVDAVVAVMRELLFVLQRHPHTHHIVTPGFVDRHRQCDGTAGQVEGKAGWWTTSGKIGFPPLSREWVDNKNKT